MGGINIQKKINQAGPWERFCKTLYQKVDLYMEANKSQKACRQQLAIIKGGYNGNKSEFRSLIINFWKKYNIKPNKMWYDLYCLKDNEYNPYYIPGDIYWQKIYPALNKTDFRQAYTDKCFYKQIFPHLKQPSTILKNSNGCFFDNNNKIISYKQAKMLLKKEKEFVIKPSINSGEGVNILFYQAQNSKDLNIDELLKRYDSNYIIQELVKQHDSLAKIHPESLNTIRIISFLFKGKIHISSSILRVGVAGSRIDNISAGGIACPIYPDGRLKGIGINSQLNKMSSHPNGTIFSEIKIPSYKRVLEKVKELHNNVPYFRIIGWDFSIDKEGDPVFIEYNGAPGLNQISCGPLFGDYTEAMLDMIFLNKAEFNA